jgi:hypothetical protein
MLPDPFRTLVHNCIETYSELFNDKLSLDYNEVTGKMRTLILNDEEYIQKTRSLRAKQILEEKAEINELANIARGNKNSLIDDPRGGDDDDGIDKDMINMRIKIMQEKRTLLGLNKGNDEADETNSLNIFFIPISREETELLETAEILKEDNINGKNAFVEEDEAVIPYKLPRSGKRSPV